MLDLENFVVFELVRELEKCVGIEENGFLKFVENCYFLDDYVMFGVYLIVRKK